MISPSWSGASVLVISETRDRDLVGRGMRPTSDTSRLGSDVDQLAGPVLLDQGQKVFGDKERALKSFRSAIRLKAGDEGRGHTTTMTWNPSIKSCWPWRCHSSGRTLTPTTFLAGCFTRLAAKGCYDISGLTTAVDQDIQANLLLYQLLGG